MAEPETKKRTSTSSIMSDWSQLPEELLCLISTHIQENCFDIVHARSVCTSWRSAFPFPSCLPSYSLPSFISETEDLCTLKKVPLILFRVGAPDSPKYYMRVIGRHELEDHMELTSPLQCKMKLKIPGSDPTSMNMVDCQILSLGHQYRMICKKLNSVAFLRLDKEEGKRGDFVVLLAYSKPLMVLTSAEMRWKQLVNVPDDSCLDIVTYKGKFYATFFPQEIFVIDPYSLKVTPLFPPPQDHGHFLVPCGDDELFLVGTIIPSDDGVSQFNRLTCRVSRLDEEAGTWVEVSNLGDRVFFITEHYGNFSCSVKELPHGCGLTANSILFSHLLSDVAFPYRYGVHIRNSWKNRLVKLKTSFPIMAFPAEHY